MCHASGVLLNHLTLQLQSVYSIYWNIFFVLLHSCLLLKLQSQLLNPHQIGCREIEKGIGFFG